MNLKQILQHLYRILEQNKSQELKIQSSDYLHDNLWTQNDEIPLLRYSVFFESACESFFYLR